MYRKFVRKIYFFFLLKIPAPGINYFGERVKRSRSKLKITLKLQIGPRIIMLQTIKLHKIKLEFEIPTR